MDARPTDQRRAPSGDMTGPAFWDSAFQGDILALTEHINRGANVNAWPPVWKSAYQPTALSYAVWGNQPAAVKVLLEHGANPNQPDGVRAGPSRIAQFLLAFLTNLSPSPLSAGRQLPPSALGVVQKRPL